MEKKRNRKIKYRTLICSAAGAFFCGFGANWGSQLDRNGNVAVTDLYSWLIPFLMACVLTPVFYLVVEKLTGIEASGDRLVSHSNKKAPDAGQQLQRGWKKLFQSQHGMRHLCGLRSSHLKQWDKQRQKKYSQ